MKFVFFLLVGILCVGLVGGKLVVKDDVYVGGVVPNVGLVGAKLDVIKKGDGLVVLNETVESDLKLVSKVTFVVESEEGLKLVKDKKIKIDMKQKEKIKLKLDKFFKGKSVKVLSVYSYPRIDYSIGGVNGMLLGNYG